MSHSQADSSNGAFSWKLHLLSALFIAFCILILVSSKEVLDLQKQVVGYAIFHQNHTNIVCHEVCVWPIVWTFYCMFHHSQPLVKSLPFTNYAFVVTTIYTGYYLSLNSGPLEGTPFTKLAVALILSCWATSGLAARLFPGKAAYTAAAINVLCWIAQFYTHGVYEGRAPALLKNPAQAVLLAPLFVFLEVLADCNVGDYRARMALVQPDVIKGVKLLEAGEYEQVSQLDLQLLPVVACIICAAVLFLLPMHNASTSRTKAM